MLPLTTEFASFAAGDFIFIENVPEIIRTCGNFKAKLIRNGKSIEIVLNLDAITEDEKQIILSGCLINYYKQQN